MRDAERVAQRKMLRDLERDLHDLCQPVTSLQCRLELGKVCGGEEALMESTDGALEDTARIFVGVTRMRERLLAATVLLEGKRDDGDE